MCHSDVSNTVSKQLWLWCLSCNIWISAAHIAGKSNQLADLELRQNKMDTKWMLNKNSLSCALTQLNFPPEIDLFASGDENGNLRECTPPGRQISPAPPKPSQCDPPTTQATLPPGLSLIRQTLTSHSIPTKAKDIIMACWCTGTTKQYEVYLKRWEQFCQSQGINQFDASVDHGH